MKDIFIFEGKKYISARRASEISDYSSDYIGQLCRSGKLDCRMEGRSWFVTEESLNLHKTNVLEDEVYRNRIENLRGKKPKDTTEEKVKISENKKSESESVEQTTPFISTKRASEISNYSPDYIGQLCRSEKLDCRMVGRSWFVTEESLNLYKVNVLHDEVYRNRIENLRGKKSKDITGEEIGAQVPDPQPSLSEQFISSEMRSFLASKMTYEHADDPLLPALNKYADKTTEGALSDSTEIVGGAMIPIKTPYTNLARSIILKRALRPAVMIAMFLVVFGGTTIVFNKIKNSSNISVAKISELNATILDAFKSTSSFLQREYDGLLALFKYRSELALNTTDDGAEISDVETPTNNPSQGIAIVPSTGLAADDEAAKQKIQDSFSDQIEVHPDNSGTSGIITPVFRTTKGNDFVYVLVPINEQK